MANEPEIVTLAFRGLSDEEGDGVDEYGNEELGGDELEGDEPEETEGSDE